MPQETLGTGEPPRGIEGTGEPPRGSEGTGEPPRGRVGFLGTGEPPHSRLAAQLSVYLDTEESEKDPLLHAGVNALMRYLHDRCGTPTAPASPAAAAVPPKRRQSRRNRAFTAALELARHAQVAGAPGSATVKLTSAPPWTGTPLAGPALKAQAEATMRLSTEPAAAERMIEIVSQAHAVELLFALELGLSVRQHPRTVDLIDLASAAIAAPLYEVKRMLDVERPSEMVPGSQPRIPVPGHASFPSGHATASHALAVLLKGLCKTNAQRSCRLDELAARLADNRHYARLHTDSDTAAGTALGQAIGAWLGSQALRALCKQWGDLYDEAASEWP